MDIDPVFKWSTGGYGLPSGDGRWITTDPELQAEWLSRRRTALGQNLTPIIRMVKRWNRVHSGRISSYHLEVMVASMFHSLSGNWRVEMRRFFELGYQSIDVNDPAGHSGRLSNYLTPDARAQLKSRLSEAKARADRAILHEAAGQHEEAKRLWRIELGDEFPLT